MGQSAVYMHRKVKEAAYLDELPIHRPCRFAEELVRDVQRVRVDLF